MNDGKPTKAKWWSRPRPQVPPGDAGVGSSEVADGPGGAADARTPGGAVGTRSDVGTPGSTTGQDTGGDFELDRPAAVPAARRSGADGDFELERPAPVRRTSAQGGDAAPTDHVPAPGDIGEAHVPSVPTQVTEALAQVTQGGTGTDPGAAAERAKPLHDPDPYSTPPYGRPGPWAPAPPVQHPGATPAHGTHMSAGTPAQGTHVPAGTPAQGTPFDAPPNGTASMAHAPAGAPPAAYAGTAHEAPVQSPQPPTPWQNYDPWAAPAPLQQNGAAVATVTQRRKRAKKVLVLGAVVLALVSGGVGGAVGAYLERNGEIGDVELPQAGKEAPGRASDSVAGIAAHALPSVVTLHVRGSQEEGTGTGFVLDGQGHILTNNHVIEPAGSGGEISVTFSGGETAKAKVVGHDSGYDLAVVKVSGVSGLDPMPLGNSDNVQVGDPVVAIGAPFDLANTVTSGIISAKERPITAGGEKGDGSDVSYVDALQTDAPINPGNSGGPLLDSKARVIGINSAIRSAGSGSDLEGGQAGSIGLGFAIPINQGKRVAEELINTGKATHPVIGVTLDMNYAGDGARVGTKGNGGGPPVTAGGPGAVAGIKAGDVITEVDGQRVHSGEELIVKTRAHRPGDRLRLTLRRGDTQKKVTLVLGSADGD
ncbi:protease [Streptomyces albiflavescens]|uniref:Protease n=1 Tax=Streptomyces albiflavescens TaxID=1623582 RepID=A0A918D8J5_9ACTN|nr:trypsin-like peptidase domain-containing protein [Streptomyces albiflavescens]GGN82741.1 protease [Streptomyces albiflavescens]